MQAAVGQPSGMLAHALWFLAGVAVGLGGLALLWKTVAQLGPSRARGAVPLFLAGSMLRLLLIVVLLLAAVRSGPLSALAAALGVALAYLLVLAGPFRQAIMSKWGQRHND